MMEGSGEGWQSGTNILVSFAVSIEEIWWSIELVEGRTEGVKKAGEENLSTGVQRNPWATKLEQWNGDLNLPGR